MASITIISDDEIFEDSSMHIRAELEAFGHIIPTAALELFINGQFFDADGVGINGRVDWYPHFVVPGDYKLEAVFPGGVDLFGFFVEPTSASKWITVLPAGIIVDPPNGEPPNGGTPPNGTTPPGFFTTPMKIAVGATVGIIITGAAYTAIRNKR